MATVSAVEIMLMATPNMASLRADCNWEVLPPKVTWALAAAEATETYMPRRALPIHAVHQRPTSAPESPLPLLVTDGRLPDQISIIAWQGFQKFAIGQKYQPTEPPGDIRIRSAWSGTRFL